MWGALQLAARMRAQGQSAALVTLLCDSGERYLETYYNAQWVAEHIGDIQPVESADCAAAEIKKARPKSGLLEGSHYSGEYGRLLLSSQCVKKWDTASLPQCPITGR